MGFIKSEPLIQFGNSSVKIRWVIQDGKALWYFSSRSYHWLYSTVSCEIIFFFQVNFSLYSFVISYERLLQPGLNFIQDETRFDYVTQILSLFLCLSLENIFLQADIHIFGITRS